MSQSHRTYLNSYIITLLTAVVVMLPAMPARAASRNWGGGSGNWSNIFHWSTVGSPPGLPADGDDLYIVPYSDGVARTINYDYTGVPLTFNSLSLDLTGPGAETTTFAMAANDLTATSEYVGEYGRGTFDQSGGTNTIAAGAGYLGVGVLAGSTGTYNLSGTGALVSNSNETVGNIGTGVFNQTGGTNTVVGDLYLGYHSSGGGGTYLLDAGLLSVGGDEYIGLASTGTFTQTGGTHTTAGDTKIGYGADTTGFATVTGLGSTWSIAGSMSLASNGTGTLTIEDGGSMSSRSTTIAGYPGKHGYVFVTGAGSSWTNSEDMYVGYRGNSSLSITDGGTVSSRSAFLGYVFPANGSVTVSGANSAWNLTGRLALSGSSDGEVKAGTGSLEVDPGGTVSVAQDTALFPDGTLKLLGGEFATSAISFQDGGGQFVWASGTLHVGNYAGDLLNPAGTLAPGRIAPENRTGTTTIVGNYNQYTDAALEIEIGGTPVSGDFDLVNITGSASLGGQLDLALLDGFTPDPGQTFTVLNAAGGISNVFANITTGERLTTTDGLGSFQVNYGVGSALNQNQIILSDFESLGLPGDFDHDGDVDGGDFLVWQRGNSPNGINSGDLAIWQSHYGSPPLVAASSAVPEPSSQLLLLAATSFCFFFRTRTLFLLVL